MDEGAKPGNFHEKAWMNETGIKLWINNMWNRRPGGLAKRESLLVWDMFWSHITEFEKRIKKPQYYNYSNPVV